MEKHIGNFIQTFSTGRLLSALALMSLAGCSSQGDTAVNVVPIEARARDIVAARVVDPTSIQIDRVRYAKTDLCGRVNLKNRSGNFTGWTRFVVSKDGTVAFDSAANPASGDAIQNEGREPDFATLYQANCETASEREQRQVRDKADEEEKMRLEKVAADERKAQEMTEWATGSWITLGNTHLCAGAAKVYRANGVLEFTGLLSDTPAGTWSIDRNGNVVEEDSRFGVARSKMQKVSQNVADITREGEKKRFERCPPY